MQYSDLFELNPIQTVIKLEDSNAKTVALDLVGRFVVTPSLADMLNRVAMPQLAKTPGVEGKGIFVVGHYGTGKSHVMSFLSALAEHADAVPQLRETARVVPSAYSAFAGKFIVRRTQIAGSKMSLYDIVADELTALAGQHAVAFQFAPEHRIVNAKNELARYLTALEPVLQGRGVLFVVDELLHYLEGRNDQDLVVDLQVLQALGEFCDGRRFVFMAGIQRNLFQHPRFNGKAEELNRVRQRFYDFIIDSKGVEELIEGYLFAKSPEQTATIRKLIEPFKDLFESIGPGLDRFVALFPAHPLFLDEFAQVSIVERREILTVLSNEGAALRTRAVDPVWPELITADRYWYAVARDSGLDSNDAVKRVKHNAEVLDGKVKESALTAEEKAIAMRLVAALAVNRLTTPNLSDPVGLTPEALKNRLLPKLQLPMRDATMLTQMVKRLLDKTREAASGQFLAATVDGSQYYIDPFKVVDFDEQVRADAKTVDRRKVQAYFNQLLLQQLEMENAQPTREGTLWAYRLLWRACNVERPGWLFFGVPSQRSTAKPPKDFYLFVLPSPRISGIDEPVAATQPADEVYFVADGFPTARREVPEEQQAGTPETFLDYLWLFAAAKERALLHKAERDASKALEAIAKRYHDQLRAALDQHQRQWFRVRHGGLVRSVADWVQERLPGEARAAFSTQFAALAEHLVEPHFTEKYPGYPKFSIKIAEPDDSGRGGRAGAAQSALEMVCEQGAGINGNSEGRAVLRGLKLLPDGIADAKPADIDPDESPWLSRIKARLADLEPGQFLNSGDIYEQRADSRWFMIDGSIEAEWLHVVLAAGARNGDVVLVGDNERRYDASNLGKLYGELRTYEKLVRIASPQDFPTERWRAIFKILGLNVGLLANDSTRDDAAKKLVEECQRRGSAGFELRQRLNQPLPMTAGDVPTPAVDLAALDACLTTLDYLKAYTTRAKMLNLRLTMDAIDAFGKQVGHVAALQALADFLRDQGPKLAAVERLTAMLRGRAVEFEDTANALRNCLLAEYQSPAAFASRAVALAATVREVATSGCGAYRGWHKHRRLTTQQDKVKQALINGREWKQLRALTAVRLLEGGAAYNSLSAQVGALKTFREYTDEALLASPTTQPPLDAFDPRAESNTAAADELEHCAAAALGLRDDWVERLLKEVADPSIQQSKRGLRPEEHEAVAAFESTRRLPEPGPGLDLLIRVLNDLLAGLKRIDVTAEEVAEALLDPKNPLRFSEIEQRLVAWLRVLAGNDEREAIRVALVAPTPTTTVEQ